ncbi:hypothetical protein [Palaeococcus ferrophilus]|uniref:hypothetical protein n=1 Tax=Palaeococcus ferrophilus TaxID=83868 RepID=UPI00064E7368|nr:hypothetical protein [Palaeococcus ferrophilus]
MDLLEGVLIFAFIWAGPSALLSAWLRTKFAKESALRAFLGSLVIITGFIFAVIGVNGLYSKFYSDALMGTVLTVYFPLAGIVWVGIEHLRGYNLPRAQILAKLSFPLLGAVMVGAGEISWFIMLPVSFFLLVLTITIPEFYWPIVRLLLKKVLGIPLKKNLGVELLLTVVGFISGRFARFFLLRILPGLMLSSEIGSLLIFSIIPYLIIGFLDSLFNFKLRSMNREISLEKRVLLVTVSLYLSLAFVGYMFVAWYIGLNDGT